MPAADLTRPDAYQHRPARVDLIETHISWVFLAGDLVYKVKKPVDFGFLDFTTLDKREFFCEEEVRLNRRLCPDLYLGVRPVSRGPEGRLVIGAEGERVDFAVEMRRLPDNALMTERLDAGQVGPDTMDAIAGLLADFHRDAAAGGRIDDYGRVAAIRHLTDEDFWQTADFVGQALSGTRFDHIKAYTDDFLAARRDLLERRLAGGMIREGHGDLHMGNICLGERIWIFDCIEFNEGFRCADQAADLAFLAMDLDVHGRPDLSERLVSVYQERRGDAELRSVLDFYKCYRAYVRGKVACLRSDQHIRSGEDRKRDLADARRHFDWAYRYAGGKRRPRIVVFFGLMGTGKSHWARQAAGWLGAPVIGSDRIRKRLGGVCSDVRVYVPYGQGMYSPEMNDAVYAEMHARAEDLAAAGMDVILDASYMEHARRLHVLSLAGRTNADLLFVRVTAAGETVMARLKAREEKAGSASDGRREIAGDQAGRFETMHGLEPARCEEIATDNAPETTAKRLRELLGV